MRGDPKVIKYPKDREHKPSVEIQPHPNEVIDVEPQVIAVMKARLAGDSLEHLYSRDDQVTNELAIERERQKLKAVFRDSSDVFNGFSSLEALKVTKSKLREQEIDRELLARYAKMKTAGQSVDEADLYAHLISGCELRSKETRVRSLKDLTPTLGREAREVVDEVAKHYSNDAFGVFGVSQEMVEIHPRLKVQLKNGRLQGAVDEVLQILYGRAE